MRASPRSLWLLVVALHAAAVASAHRLIPLPTDAFFLRTWATMAVERGPLAIYSWEDAEVAERHASDFNMNYPPFVVYLYGPPAWLLDQFGVWPPASRPLADLAIRLPIAGLQLAGLALLARRRVAAPAGLKPARILVLVGCNPVLLLAGPVWGQLDVALWAAMTLGVLAQARAAPRAGGCWTALGVILKPQSLLFWPVLAAVAARRRSAAEAGTLLAAALLAVALLTAPFLATTGLLWAERGYVRVFADNPPAVTVTGYNFWWAARLVTGVEAADEPFAGLTAKRLGLLAAGLLGAAAGSSYAFGRRDRSPLGLATVFLTGCFFFLTGMNERFLIYGAASAALWATADRRALPACLLLNLAQLINLPFNTVQHNSPPWVGQVSSLVAVVCVAAGLVAAIATSARTPRPVEPL